MSGIKVSDLPPSYQAQVLRQLAKSSSPTAMTNFVAPPKGCKPHPTEPVTNPSKPSSKSSCGIRITAKRQMNDNERKYQADILKGAGMFEAITMKLPGGSRYTPDFCTFDTEGRLTVHEVKGDYHLHSHGRAVTAFKECAAHFPHVTFVWAAYFNGVFHIQKINEK